VTDTTHAPPARDTHTRSAVGRVIMLVDVSDGTERITYERRLADAGAARQWCEEKVECAADGATFLEIQVTEEVWGLRHAWEATPSRHIPETLQLGLRGDGGTTSRDAPRPAGNDGRTRRL
jgi:hypothetical protein